MGFFNRGFTTAVLKASGKTAVLSDVFIMSRTGPDTLSNTRLKNMVGIGSISEVVELHSMTVLESSLSHLALIEVILFLKNRASSSHLAAEDSGGAGTVFRSRSMVEKRTLEFPAFSVIMLEK